jgi:hypothetical protein
MVSTERRSPDSSDTVALSICKLSTVGIRMLKILGFHLFGKRYG